MYSEELYRAHTQRHIRTTYTCRLSCSSRILRWLAGGWWLEGGGRGWLGLEAGLEVVAGGWWLQGGWWLAGVAGAGRWWVLFAEAGL